MQLDELPKYHELMRPILIALHKLGGSAALAEINSAAFELTGLGPEALEIEYPSGNGLVIPDRMSWARSRLKRAGFLASGGRGIWVLTDDGREAMELSPAALKQIARQKKQRARVGSPNFSTDVEQADIDDNLADDGEAPFDWRDELLGKLKLMDPSAFERLAQRLLRESGFVKVEVTGRSGDGGIDGTGIMQLSLMSFHVLFQCKRYQGSVGSGAVRDFRGAMMGRTDKGLIITTGTFSPDARREATRDGAPPIDLIDGEALCEKLKELSLGVETKLVEEVSIKSDWFDQI